MKKKLSKYAGYFLGVVMLIVTGIFIVNATDVDLSAEAAEALVPLPTQPGYPMRKLQFTKDARPERVEAFSTIQEYIAKRAEFDALLEKNNFALAPLLEAMDEGQLAVERTVGFNTLAVLFPFESQKYLLILLSQKFTSGKTMEAIDLLEKSNRFLASIISNPQALINTHIALSALRTNAKFAASLVQNGILTKSPSALKNSFEIPQTPQQIFETAIKAEMHQALAFMNVEKLDCVGTGIHDPGKENFLGKIEAHACSALFRPHQTINHYVKIMNEVKTSACPHATPIEECSKTFKQEAYLNSPSNVLVNPTGRVLLRVFIPSLPGQKKKIEQLVGDTKNIVAGIN